MMRDLEEPAAFRRLSLSLVQMALLTGVVLRLLRAVAFALGQVSWLLFAASIFIAFIILIGMTTAHLANYSPRRWAWRAPLFAGVVSLGAMSASLLLIALRHEPEGAARAEFHDWPSMALRFLAYSELTVCLWALLLAGVIALLRWSSARSAQQEP